MAHRGDDGGGHHRSARRRLLPANRSRRTPSLPPRDRRVRRRHGRNRLHAGNAPRVRRRSHRGDRQHDAQADVRRQAAAERRVLLRAWARNDRLRARLPVLGRHPRAGWSGRRRRLAAAQRRRLDRNRRLGHVPVRHRRAERRDPVGHRQGLPRDAIRSLRRDPARAAARVARAHEPLLRPVHAHDQPAVAHVPDRPAVRARASTPQPRSRCCSWPPAPPGPACRSTRSSACRSCSPRG